MRNLIDLIETMGIQEKKFWIDWSGDAVEVDNHDMHMEDNASTREEAFADGCIRLNISYMSNGHSELNAEFEGPVTYLALKELIEMISGEIVSRYQINNDAFDDPKRALMFLKKLASTKRKAHLDQQEQRQQNAQRAQQNYIESQLNLARKYPDQAESLLRNFVIDDQSIISQVARVVGAFRHPGRPLKIEDLDRPYSIR